MDFDAEMALVGEHRGYVLYMDKAGTYWAVRNGLEVQGNVRTYDELIAIVDELVDKLP